MRGYERVRDGLRDGTLQFDRLDAAQLIKHAFGLRTAAHAEAGFAGKKPVLFYLYAEPKVWPASQDAVSTEDQATHRKEIGQFASIVAGDEVEFRHAPYAGLLAAWQASEISAVQSHAAAVTERFAP
jgi:hypothetical protein